MLRAESNISVGGEVKNDITAVHGPGERTKVEGIALAEREAWIRNGAVEKPTETG